MTMLWNVPIENIESRYSAQWNEYFPTEFERFQVPFHTIPGHSTSGKIKRGEFLDVIETLQFKAKQMQQMLQLLEEEKVGSGDVFFFHDLWFPGLEALFYARDLLNIPFKIAGILHAGAYVKHDFLNRKEAGWGANLEKSWFNEVDFIFVATKYHEDLLKATRLCGRGTNIFATGLPLPVPLFTSVPKENIVVFPHRIAEERQPHLFNVPELKGRFPKWDFIKSMEAYTTKEDYYRLLCRSRVVVSCSIQETWGIAIQEGVFAGCIPWVPQAFSYLEMYPDWCTYAEESQPFSYLFEVLLSVLERNPHWKEREITQLGKDMKRKNAQSVVKMLRIMRIVA